MTHRAVTITGLAVACLLTAAAPLARQTTAEVLFREALVKERAEGNLREAIFRYERLIAEFPRERQIAAKAMYQLYLAYEKLRDPRARVMLTRLTREYGEVEPYASRARSALLALQAAAQRAAFPSVTLDPSYELGSPDGSLVVFHRNPADWARVYVKELATGKERLLIDQPGDSVSNFAWSPDSRRLAYNLYNSDNKVNDIRIAQIATGENVSLGVRGYPLQWTEAGQILFFLGQFSAGGIEYFLVPATGGTPRKILFGQNCCPAITSDASRLIMPRSRRLFVIDIASGAEWPLTTFTGEEVRPIVSPDGRLVAFAANPDGDWALYAASLGDGLPVKNPLKIAPLDEVTAGGPQWWTRDGLLTFGYTTAQSDVYRVGMDPRSGRAIDAPVRLTQDAHNNWASAIAPDGKHVAYWFRNGIRYGLAVMDSDGANERPVFDQNLVLHLGWRSSEEILFCRARQGEKVAISTLNINTGAVKDVASVEGLYFRYVPGRDEILHLYPGGGGPRPGATLKALSLSDGKERVVAVIDYLLPRLEVSPDGKRIAYVTSRPGEGAGKRLYEMQVMSVDGKPEGTLIAAQPEGVAPTAWSPDGRYLLCYQEATGPRVMNVQTRESWPLHPDLGGHSGGTSWSPDGTFIIVDKETTERRTELLAWEGVTADAVARLLARR